ncbi:MAG TPA: YebC/PmpR family DNA-binding transcriptional regulator, partial [Firmicutes bacterium]|nr:YebC/PmpR family DNA-binding transcriptional regulator [Bacillota bacterium]
MSGHSKWNTIKRKKGAADAKRGKIFSKIIKELMAAVREGGADPNTNLALKNVIEKAKQNNVPNDNIERAIKRASGEDANAAAYEEIVYEGYGPASVAFYVEALT